LCTARRREEKNRSKERGVSEQEKTKNNDGVSDRGERTAGK